MTRRNMDIIGWAGVLAILVGFTLSVFGILSFRSPIYLWLNFLGAMAVMIEALQKRDYQPVVLNVIWALIAAYGIVRGLLT